MKTCLPAASAADASGKCVETGVAIATASMLSSARTSSKLRRRPDRRVPPGDRARALLVGVADGDDLRLRELVEVADEVRPPVARGRPRRRARVRPGEAQRSSGWIMPLPPLSAASCERRLEEQPEVEAERPAADVGDVHVERLAERRARPRRDLPEPRDARRARGSARSGAAGSARSRTGRHGRGPTSDMSPRSTLISCGSSSRLVFRSQRPTRRHGVRAVELVHAVLADGRAGRHRRADVRRGGRRRPCPTFIVRNFRSVNSRMPRPSRVWRKKTGPGESRLMRHAQRAKSGRGQTSRIDGADDVDQRASASCDDRRQPDRRKADQREALDRVHRRPSARSTRTAAARRRSARRRRAASGSTLHASAPSGSLEKATITRSTSKRAHDLGQRVARPEERHVRRARRGASAGRRRRSRRG